MASALLSHLTKVRDRYQTSDLNTFRQRTIALLTWTQGALTGSAVDAIQKLCRKTDHSAPAFGYLNAFRTSNMIDLNMKPLDRGLFHTRFFNDNWRSAQRQRCV